ncbi:MAG: RNase adapter RapZ [Candidatus Binatia bacterium]
MTVLLVSFGYKFGVPTDVDMVLDALPAQPVLRRAAHPHRRRSGGRGLRPRARWARTFLALTEQLLDFALPLYRREGRTYFTLAVGCTGGRHRSVALVERLAQTRARAGLTVQVRHRDVRR